METLPSSSSDSELRVRPAVDEDVPALTELINAAFVVEQSVFGGDRVDELGVRAYMGSGTFLLAEDSSLAGCVYIEIREDHGYLGLLSVQPARQRAGFGRRLTAAAENFARDAGAAVMDLRVISARAPQLLPFYQSLGYAVIRKEPFPINLIVKQPSHYIFMSKPLR